MAMSQTSCNIRTVCEAWEQDWQETGFVGRSGKASQRKKDLSQFAKAAQETDKQTRYKEIPEGCLCRGGKCDTQVCVLETTNTDPF